MSTLQDLQTCADKARAWMMGESFPFWAQHGLHEHGGFQERMSLAGAPLNDETSRVRLQARQTFCFAFAKILGWDGAQADALVSRGLSVLTQHCIRPDGLFGKQVRLGEGLSDDRADLYDTAFALLAFSVAGQAGHTGASALAAQLSAAIDDVLARPASEGGYREALPPLEYRLQNPHMHLFESSLAYFSLSKDAKALARTQAIKAFIAERFFDANTGTLHEITHLDGSPHEDDRFEIGHKYEWAWLLHTHARLTGDALSPMAKPLYESARALTHGTGRIALSHRLDGTILEPVYRTWGQTEALKAHIAAYERGWTGIEPIVQTFDLLWADHIAPAPKGAWIDRVDANGQPTATDITAATGYHIYVALEDLMRVAGAA